jgi:hypothetical protein
MRRSFPVLVLLLTTVAACNKAPDRGLSNQGAAHPANPAAESAASPAMTGGASRDGGPNVGVTAAPGVAFNYQYAFRLAPTRIAEVQEQHAQMCEQLTVARCRITGMFYRVNNDHDVEGMLAFSLDPAIARRFGREGVESVVRAEGQLAESEITGTDVGTRIHAVSRSIAELQADLARIEARLRTPNLDPEEKSRLDDQAQQLRDEIRAGSTVREEQQASLATTPMVFRYASGEPTLGQTLQDTGNGFLDSAYILLRILITLIPWAIAGAIGWAAVIVVRRRLAARRAAAGQEDVA